MAENKNIAFRKIRGRIVPIRMNKETKLRVKDGAVGALLAGAGAAAASVSGAVHKGILKVSTSMSARAMRSLERAGGRAVPFGQLSLKGFQKSDRAASLALKLSERAAKISTVATPLRKVGQFTGAVLLGLGASKVARAVNEEKNETLESTIGLAASTLAFRSKGASQFLFKAGGYPRAAASELRKKAYPTLRKIKLHWNK